MKGSGFSLNNLFSRKAKLSLGVDIGSHAVKICELAEGPSGHKLVSMGSSLLPVGAVEDGVLQDPGAVSNAIAALVKNLKVKTKKAAISISGYSVIVKKISLSVMTDEEMEKHIHSEAEQYIPFDIDDVYLDFQNLQTNTEDDDRTDVMLVAAKKDVVDAYLEMLKSTGLTASVVDVDAFALENSFEDNFNLDENIALVDIGASKMNINIIYKGTSILARDVAVGSRQLTEQIQSLTGGDFDEAEDYKLGKRASDEQAQELGELFSSVCMQWVNEIQRAIDFFVSNYPDDSISKIMLSGGGSRIQGFDELLTRETGVPAELFNPFNKISFDTGQIDQQYVSYMAPEMAISVGLATRPVEI